MVVCSYFTLGARNGRLSWFCLSLSQQEGTIFSIPHFSHFCRWVSVRLLTITILSTCTLVQFLCVSISWTPVSAEFGAEMVKMHPIEMGINAHNINTLWEFRNRIYGKSGWKKQKRISRCVIMPLIGFPVFVMDVSKPEQWPRYRGALMGDRP